MSNAAKVAESAELRLPLVSDKPGHCSFAGFADVDVGIAGQYHQRVKRVIHLHFDDVLRDGVHPAFSVVDLSGSGSRSDANCGAWPTGDALGSLLSLIVELLEC